MPGSPKSSKREATSSELFHASVLIPRNRYNTLVQSGVYGLVQRVYGMVPSMCRTGTNRCRSWYKASVRGGVGAYAEEGRSDGAEAVDVVLRHSHSVSEVQYWHSVSARSAIVPISGLDRRRAVLTLRIRVGWAGMGLRFCEEMHGTETVYQSRLSGYGPTGWA
eukprot:3941929-Rhodomonas_salina.1